MKTGFTKVSILFPGGEDELFDLENFRNKHVSDIKKLLGDSVECISVETGISGGAPGSVPPYIAVVEFYFETINAFEDNFKKHAEEIIAGIINIASSKPLIQISEVVWQDC